MGLILAEADRLLKGGWDWLIILVMAVSLTALATYAVTTRGPEDE